MQSEIVHSLIQAYGLLDKLDVISPKIASTDDLENYHGSEFVISYDKR
jgi:hypothetical protein